MEIKNYIFIYLFSFLSFSQQKNSIDSVKYYTNKNNIPKALEISKKLADTSLKKNDIAAFCIYTSKKAKLYLKLKDYENGIKVLFDAQDIISKKKLVLEKAIIKRSIGEFFFQYKKYDKAEISFKDALILSKKSKNDTLTGQIYTELCKIYGGQEDYNKYGLCVLQSLKHLKNGTLRQKCNAYANVSGYYQIVGEFEIAKKYLDTAYNYSLEVKDKSIFNTLYSNYAYYYTIAKKDHKKAEEYYIKILKINKNDTLNDLISNNYANLSYVYEQMHDYKKANYYLNKERVNRAVLYDKEINNQVNDVETRYKVKKAEDEFKNREKKLKEIQRKRQLYFIIIIITLLFLISLLAFYFQNIKLKQQNKLKEIEGKVKEDLINATIDGQESERKNVANVLHDNVSALLSAAGLQLMAFATTQNNPSEEISKARSIIKDAHDKVRDLSHQLVPTLLSKFGLIYAMQDLCEKQSNSIVQIDFSSNIDTSKRFNDDFEMKLYFIISEIINNVIKHSEARNCNVSIKEKNEILEIEVSDNGKGFDKKNEDYKEGFGITQIRARINNLNGKFSIHSKINKGTKTEIEVPIPEKV